jgi:hypothetical protein
LKVNPLQEWAGEVKQFFVARMAPNHPVFRIR